MPSPYILAEPAYDETLEDLVEDDDLPELSGERTRTEASFGELGELRTWQRLVDLAECAGKQTLAAAFRRALDEERANGAGWRH